MSHRANAAVPTVVTNAVGSISNDSAVLNGTVNPNGASTDTFFEYSTQASLSQPEVVTTLAGNATAGFVDATGATAQFNTPTGVAMDAAGNVYVADSANNRIRKVTPDGVVSTFAGTGAPVPFMNGNSGTATFNTPTGVAVDGNGNVYVADKGNNRIRKISGGVVSTLAGSGTPGSLDNNNGALAQFFTPTGLAVDGSGNVYVADSGNHRIRKVTSAGAVTTLAGSTAGFFDATGALAHFTAPYGVALDASGSNLYVADTYNYRIRVVTTGGATPGVVTTLAGNSAPGNIDATGAAAMFNWPTGVAVDSAGLLYVADSGNHRIRRVTSGGVVTTLAGNHLGFNDGTGTSALFSTPTGLVVDAANHVLIADRDNQRIRVFGFSRVAAQTALTGTSNLGMSASLSALASATTYYYRAVATNSDGRAYAGNSSFRTFGTDINLSDLSLSSGSLSSTFSNTTTYYTSSAPYSTTHLKVTPIAEDSGAIMTVNNVPLTSGSASQLISLNPGVNTISVVVTQPGTGSQIYTIVVVRAFASPPVVETVAATNLGAGAVALHGTVNPSSLATDSSFIYSTSPTLQPEVATLASITEPVYLTADSLGNVYVADGGLLRKITPQGAVSVLAGGGTSGVADGTGTEAQFDFIFGITADGADNLYAEDSGHTKIRKITPAGVVTTLPNIAPYTSVGLASDTEGNLYFMDGPRIVRRSINGTFHELAGGTTAGYVDAQGDAARFGSAEALAVDLLGNVYMADSDNNAVRKITPDGVVTTLAGGGTWGYVDDIGPAARFDGPKDLTVDDQGNVYVLDKQNFRIRKVTPDGVVTTIAGSGVSDYIDGTGTAAAFHSSFGLAGRLNGDLYLADTASYKIRSILSQRLGAQTGLVGNTAQDISASLSGLVVGNTYYYSASATNSGGRADGGILSFTVLSSDASLSGLEISSGTLSPTFASNTGLYSVTVSNAVTSITVTPTVAESNATVTVNGNAVASGSASASIALNPGDNTIPMVVTAQDGVTTYTYTLAVLRDPLPPVATTTAASDISDSSATLHGKVIPNGPDASASFEYSTSPTFDPVVVSTLAGSTPGYADGTGTAAQFSVISDVVVDATGNLYVLDFFNQRIRKVTASGVVSTFVGSGAVGLDDGTGTAATLSYPSDLTMDGAGNLYLVDGEDTIIRKVTPEGVVSTLTAPTDYTIHALTADTVGNLYFIAFIAETANLMKRTPDGTISLLAANTLALSLAVDASGYLYTSVLEDYSVIKISPDGLTISTLAGGTEGTADGTGTAAQFEEAQVLDVDAAGNVYVNDAVFGGRYRKITPAGVVTTLTAGPDEAGYVDGIGAVARFDTPNAAAVDAGGNLYVADTQNSRIRKISPLSVVAASGLTGNTELAVSASLTGLTPGVTYYYRTVATSADGISYGAAQSFTTLLPTVVETWLAAHFTSAERLDSQISGWTASPDNDGVNNLLEFAFGTDPRSAASGSGGVIYIAGMISQRGQPGVKSANGTDFYANFARRNDYAAAGLTYTVQFSANLTAWEDSTAMPAVVASDSEVQVVTVSFPALLGSGLKPRFFRVLVALP